MIHGESEEHLRKALATYRLDLHRHVERHARGELLRMETIDDLTQGVIAIALQRSASYRNQGEGKAMPWLRQVADNYLVDRLRYWSSLKRGGTAVLRLTMGDTESDELEEVARLATSITGPSAFASRREQVRLAAKALALLLPRDRDIVLANCKGHSLQELAQREAISVAGMERARRRALERFRKAFRLVCGR